MNCSSTIECCFLLKTFAMFSWGKGKKKLGYEKSDHISRFLALPVLFCQWILCRKLLPWSGDTTTHFFNCPRDPLNSFSPPLSFATRITFSLFFRGINRLKNTWFSRKFNAFDEQMNTGKHEKADDWTVRSVFCVGQSRASATGRTRSNRCRTGEWGGGICLSRHHVIVSRPPPRTAFIYSRVENGRNCTDPGEGRGPPNQIQYMASAASRNVINEKPFLVYIIKMTTILLHPWRLYCLFTWKCLQKNNLFFTSLRTLFSPNERLGSQEKRRGTAADKFRIPVQSSCHYSWVNPFAAPSGALWFY